jgi:two-component system chemotaxis response regulator CheY
VNGDRTILIVDDDPLIRRLIVTTLEDVAAFELKEAGDGVEALDRASEAPPEIVLLDIDMPRLNGIETCRRLRDDPATARATIVMLTAVSDDGAERRASDAGADLFLTKPFSPLDLLRLVDRLGQG